MCCAQLHTLEDSVVITRFTSVQLTMTRAQLHTLEDSVAITPFFECTTDNDTDITSIDDMCCAQLQVEFYLYPTVGTILIHSVKPELTE